MNNDHERPAFVQAPDSVIAEREHGGHTPGPWMFDEDWDRLPTVYGSDHRQVVAYIEKHERLLSNPGRQKVLPERIANARLIAASPDMLAALKKAEQWLSGWASAEPYIDTIRAAIAKAEAPPASPILGAAQ